VIDSKNRLDKEDEDPDARSPDQLATEGIELIGGIPYYKDGRMARMTKREL
jgi:hypothetical protein